MEAKDKNINGEFGILRAKIEASKDSDFDFSAIAVPVENKQLRYSYENNEYFYQVLRTGIENISTARLENGLPIFDNHPWENSAQNTLGKTVGYEFTERGLQVKVKHGARADEALRSDISNGIVNTVSIEGNVIEYSIERMQGQIPTYYANKWEPTSLSYAPVPNDTGAQIEVKRALLQQIEKQDKKEDKSIFNSLTNKF